MSRWEDAVGIRDRERGLALRLVAVFSLTQSTHALGSNSADALFFLRFGVERLPMMILISGFAVMGALLLHVLVLGRSGPRKWLPIATGLSGSWALGQWALTYLDTASVYPVIWVSTQVVVMGTWTIMWNAAAASVDTRQAKRLYPLFAAAGVAGGVVGNLLTGPLAALMGTQNLLAVQGLILGASAVLLRRVSTLFRDTRPSTRPSILTGLSAAARTTLSSRHLRLVAATLFALWSLFYLVVFPFNETVAASFESEASVAGFLGIFASIATGLTFLVSLLVTNRIFRWLGIVAALGMVPLVYALGFGTWFISLNLLTASVVRASQWVATNAIGGTATTALCNVVTGSRRNEVMTFMTAIPAQLGIAFGGLLLIVTSGMTDRVSFGIGFVISLLALLVVVLMRKAYVEAIVGAVKKGLVGVFTVPHEGLVTATDGESVRVLLEHLSSDKAEERVIALEALAQIGEPDTISPTQDALTDEDPRVRSAALEWFCTVVPDQVHAHIEVALGDPSPIVRARALELGIRDGLIAREKIDSLLDDPDPYVRMTAAMVSSTQEATAVIDQLLASEDPDLVASVLNEAADHAHSDIGVQPYLVHHDPNVRAAATRAALHAGIEAGYLAAGLEDESMLVREVTADVLAKTDIGRAVLINSLDTGTVSATQAALDALTPLDRFTEGFLSWAGTEAKRAQMLAETRDAIEKDLYSPAARLLTHALGQRAERLTRWVIQAMTTSETQTQMMVVQKGIGSTDPETRAQAVEALDLIGDRSVTVVLMGLLEAHGPGSRMTAVEALERLADDFDPWIRNLSLRCLGELRDSAALADDRVPVWNAMPTDSRDSLSLIDRVIALQRVHMFSDLDLEDLEMVAASSAESHYEPGEPIYRLGEEGTEMLVIIDGEVIVTETRGSEVIELARYGAGEHVGELSLLRQESRAADVTAGDSGVQALTIDKVDLISVLQERPHVSMAMLGTLAARLAQQGH